MTVLTFLLILVFLIGLYFYTKGAGDVEGFEGQPRCPNMLIQKGSRFYLYNSKVAKVPGVNPVEFENLEDYTEFLEWQRSKGIRCPVLYLQQTFDAQGNAVYKVRPSVSEPQGGIPPTSIGSTDEPAYPNQDIFMDDTKDTQYNKVSMAPCDQFINDQSNLPISLTQWTPTGVAPIIPNAWLMRDIILVMKSVLEFKLKVYNQLLPSVVFAESSAFITLFNPSLA